MSEIDPVAFGKLEQKVGGIEEKMDFHNVKISEGLTRIETTLNAHVEATSRMHRDLDKKIERAHDRVDETQKELSGIKGKIAVFTAVIGAAWAWLMKFILGE